MIFWYNKINIFLFSVWNLRDILNTSRICIALEMHFFVSLSMKPPIKQESLVMKYIKDIHQRKEEKRKVHIFNFSTKKNMRQLWKEKIFCKQEKKIVFLCEKKSIRT